MRRDLKATHLVLRDRPPPGVDSLSGLTKGLAEEGEQLVSLDLERGKQKHNQFMTPAGPLQPGGPKGARSKVGAVGESNKLGLHCPGTCRLSLPLRFTCHCSRCGYDGEWKDVKSSKGEEVECRDLSRT